MKYIKSEKYNTPELQAKIMGPNPVKLEEELLCDNRFLVKPVPAAAAMLPGAIYEPPYEGAKDMILVENVDDSNLMTKLFCAIYDELPESKKKRNLK